MSDPVTALFVGLLIFGLGAVVGLMAAHDTYRPTAPPDPRGHVRPVRIGTCVECRTEGVPVHLFQFGDHLVDPDDVCDRCLRDLAGEPGLTGGAA